jgi:diaminopropionate ammonia-lyase
MEHATGKEKPLPSTDRTSRTWMNPSLASIGAFGPVSRVPLEFHRKMPGYRPTPLADLRHTAAHLGLASLRLKDESARLGLPAFKVLGAWWAAYRLLCERLGHEPRSWRTPEDLAAAFVPLRPLTLCAATDGSHGRAVARFARLMGFEALVFVPSFVVAARVDAIRSEGARVEVVEGVFEDALHAAISASSERCLLVSDDSWPGYEEVPKWVLDGYATLFWEIDDALAAAGSAGPDVVFVQMGVGALAAATVRHFRRREAQPQPVIIGVEPLSAACVMEALAAGEVRQVPGPHATLSMIAGPFRVCACSLTRASKQGSPAWPVSPASSPFWTSSVRFVT